MSPVLLLVVMMLPGCAALACRPITIEVTGKEERARLARSPYGVRTTETGRVESGGALGEVREYWVQGVGGTWYRVPREDFEQARAGSPLEVCQ